MHLPTLSSRRLAGAAVLACAAALIPVAALAATAAPAAPAAASAPPCPTAGLVIWLTNGSAAAGTFYYDLNFTNLSGHACTLRGHPGVSTVNLSGSQIGRPARWGNPGNAGHARLRTVRLARGATATAVLAVTDVYNYPAGVCHRVTAAGLRVIPPNQFTSKLVPYPIGACTTSQVFMQAGVVHR